MPRNSNLCLLVLVCAAPEAQARVVGHVVYVAGEHAYLDRGAEDALDEGDDVELRRNNSPVGACRITAVAPHWAVCAGPAHVGDVFTSTRTPPAEETYRLKASERPFDHERARAYREEVAGQRFPVVSDQASGVGRASAARIHLMLGGDVWTSFSDISRRRYLAERVDVEVLGYPVGLADLAAHVQATAEHWSERPADTRFRHDASTQLYVWEAELSSRAARTPYALAVGRVNPWAIDGLAVLDGVQAGWRNESGAHEVGFFAGALPDPVTLGIETDPWSAGLYHSSHVVFGQSARLRADTHLAWVSAESERAAASTRVMIALRPRLQIEMAAQAEAPTGAVATTTLTGWGAWASAHPLTGLDVRAGVRELSTPPFATGGLLLGSWARTRYGTTGAELRINRWLELGASAATVTELTTKRTRSFAGPEVALPGILWGRGSVSAGYQEELGFAPGRSAHVGVVMSPREGLNIITRASASQDIAAHVEWYESSLYLAAEYAANDRLSLNLSALGTYGLSAQTMSKVGLVAGLGILLHL